MYQLVVYLHLLGATFWVGGLLFLVLVVVPTTRGLPPADRARLLDAVGLRFRWIGWLVLLLLAVTGTIAAGYRGLTWQNAVDLSYFASPVGQLLGLKLLVVLAMAAVTALHDFWLGPASTRALAAGAAAVGRLRKLSAWSARLSLLTALAVVALAVALVRGLP